MLSKIVVNLTGTIGSIDEIQTSDSGTKYLKFSVACNRMISKNETAVSWTQCTLFGKGAEYLSKNALKGDIISVCAERRDEKYNDRVYSSHIVINFAFPPTGRNAKNNQEEKEEPYNKSSLEDDIPF